MPKVLAQGKATECKSGANLRKVLLANDVDLYNGGSNVINYRTDFGDMLLKLSGLPSHKWK